MSMASFLLRECRGNAAVTSLQAWGKVNAGVFLILYAISAGNGVQGTRRAYDDARLARSDARIGPYLHGSFHLQSFVQWTSAWWLLCTSLTWECLRGHWRRHI